MTNLIEKVKIGFTWLIFILVLLVGLVFARMDYGNPDDYSPIQMIQGE